MEAHAELARPAANIGHERGGHTRQDLFLALDDVEVEYLVAAMPAQDLAERFDAGDAAADDDDRRRLAQRDEMRDPLFDRRGLRRRTETDAVPRGTRNALHVPDSAGGNDAGVVAQRLARRGLDLACRSIETRRRVAQESMPVTLYDLLAIQQDVALGLHARQDFVNVRRPLEFAPGVEHPDAVAARNRAGGGEPGETRADDDDLSLAAHDQRLRSRARIPRSRREPRMILRRGPAPANPNRDCRRETSTFRRATGAGRRRTTGRRDGGTRSSSSARCRR